MKLFNRVNDLNDYRALLLSKKWSDKRKEILKRDNYQCVVCGCKDGLEIHHRQYHYIKRLRRMAYPWDYENKYLVTLCKKCHQTGTQRYNVPTKEV